MRSRPIQPLAGLPELVDTPRIYPGVFSCICVSLLLRCMFEV